ncbi:MAG: sulfatase-like hydrolase/transferase [Bacteroidales bacterium]|nr:sulfatase-like hydrolase/transferase [Bacteroidales bacterium]
MKKYARFNYLLIVYLLGVLYFTLFRLVETWVFCSQAAEPIDMKGLFGYALYTGWRFDTVVSCYILALPALMMLVGEYTRWRARAFYQVAHYFINVCYTVAFFACAADIPYFCYFYSRLDVVSLTWGDTPDMVLGMIFGEWKYVLALLAFVVVAVSWWLATRWVFRRVLDRGLLRAEGEVKPAPLYATIPLALVLIFLTFTGMRGRLNRKSPIRVGTASFCEVPFLNQIGLNPAFTFIKSVEELNKSRNKPVELIAVEEAERVWAEQQAWVEDSALAERAVVLPERTNVVLVIMESMATEKTSLAESGQSLTPCLDSLMAGGRLYTNAWSAGIHTYNGIYSSLYGHPAIMHRHTMKQATIFRMCGLPQALRAAGYTTSYFMPHDADFDNMRGFLYNNGFNEVYGQSEYKASEVVGTWGVPDHTLFDYALERGRKAYAEGEPFFTTVMTCSDHSPYVIPEGISFKAKNSEMNKAIVEYADWSIGRFMRMAEKEPWFGQTLFVFVGDHGAARPCIYDISLPYNHVPILFYAPWCIKASREQAPAMQLDIAATVLGMLPQGPAARTLGVDLQRISRPYAYFSADDKVGVVSRSGWFYLWRVKEERESLYRMGETTDMIGQYADTAAAMRRYAFGMVQLSQQMLLDHTTDCR